MFFTDEEACANSLCSICTVVESANGHRKAAPLTWKVGNIDFKQIICVCGCRRSRIRFRDFSGAAFIPYFLSLEMPISSP